MNFILRVILTHIWAAIAQNWKTTVCGLIVAVFGAGPSLAPLFEGKSIDQVDWSAVATRLGAAIGLLLARDFNVMTIIKAAPRAEPVKKDDRQM